VLQQDSGTLLLARNAHLSAPAKHQKMQRQLMAGLHQEGPERTDLESCSVFRNTGRTHWWPRRLLVPEKPKNACLDDVKRVPVMQTNLLIDLDDSCLKPGVIFPDLRDLELQLCLVAFHVDSVVGRPLFLRAVIKFRLFRTLHWPLFTLAAC
jgi:hypothetical protein